MSRPATGPDAVARRSDPGPTVALDRDVDAVAQPLVGRGGTVVRASDPRACGRQRTARPSRSRSRISWSSRPSAGGATGAGSAPALRRAASRFIGKTTTK